ncbi:E motif [Dillenia turbinata]|uniref:E motif n=1 Tax=Dillenia turbinata TaxID=194707 RepID=A0AAN8WD74_9MAGN
MIKGYVQIGKFDMALEVLGDMVKERVVPSNFTVTELLVYYEEVSYVRHMMRQQNVKKTPGCSWIELKNGMHAFVTAYKTQPETNLIYAGLNSLTAR